MGDPRTGKPEEQGAEFVDEPQNQPGDQEQPPEEQEDG
jgi:hypothetical protein